MKFLKQLIFITLVFCLLTACGQKASEQPKIMMTTTEGMSEDQLAITQVIQAYDQAYFNWDTEAIKQCVTDDYSYEDTAEMLQGAFGVYVDQGDLVTEDFEKFLEIEKKYYQEGSKQLQYRGWNITVSGKNATAFVTYGYPNVDANKLYETDTMQQYRDKLFMEVCNMSEATAKATLSKPEFSNVYLQVMDLDYQAKTENVSYVEDTIELRLKSIDGQWYISELVLPEE